MASRYQVFRRVVAPIALVAALALIVHQTCQGEARSAVRFQLDLGEAAADVRQVRVDLWAGDESVGYFEARYGDAGVERPPAWTQVTPRDDLEATIALTLASGEVVALRKPVRAPPGSEVVIRVDPTR